MITAIILTKNEEESIEACLKTLKWCNEIVIIDDHSTDKTVEIAKKNGAKIFERELNNDFSAQRNYGLQQAQAGWILFIDADERVSPQLRAEITRAIKTNFVGYYLKRKDFLFGKELKHGETQNIELVRLARRDAGQWKRKVDEIWEITGKIGRLKNPLLHYSHPSISQFLKSVNFKSTLNAQVFYEEGKRTRLIDWLKPLGKFIQNYLFRLGFLDGMQGLIMALMMSFHSFLVRAKLYLLWKQEGGWGR